VLSEGLEAARPGTPSPLKLLGRALLALIVGMGGEVALLLVITGVFMSLGMQEAPQVLQPVFMLLLISTKAIVPFLMRRDGEPWRKYLGPLSWSTWLYAAGGILVLTLGFRLWETRPFPIIAQEFEGMVRYFGMPLGLLMLAMQFLYYATEGVLMVYVIVKGSEAVRAWRPICSPWLAGACGGLLLGLTWGLAHILSKGALDVGLSSLLMAMLLGFLHGRTRSGLPPWLAWMGFLTF
jgi:hypothetical protein